MLNYAEACERNKGPILAVLARELPGRAAVLEIGSGTGQHAVHFAAHLSQLTWQPTETPENLPGLAQRVQLEGTPNLLAPLPLDVREQPWQIDAADAIFSANTLHIMGWGAVQAFFRGCGATLRRPGVLCLYGPFRSGGEHTSPSNAEFDHFLKQRDPQSGVRDFEALDELARAQDLVLHADHAMPANNRTLVWRRK